MNTELALAMLIAFAQAKQIAGEWAFVKDDMGDECYVWNGQRNWIDYNYRLRLLDNGFEFQEGLGVRVPVNSLSHLRELLKHGY